MSRTSLWVATLAVLVLAALGFWAFAERAADTRPQRMPKAMAEEIAAREAHRRYLELVETSNEGKLVNASLSELERSKPITSYRRDVIIARVAPVSGLLGKSTSSFEGDPPLLRVEFADGSAVLVSLYGRVSRVR